MLNEKSIYKILKKAIRFNKFDFKFKPIYSNEKGRFTKAELEIRIIDPKFGVIKQEVFIKVAEEYGLIYEIGLILLENACKYIEILTKENIEFEDISINISLMQLDNKRFSSDLGRILEKYKVDPTKLIIEIKESEEISGIEKLKIITDILSIYGVKFAIGYFGRGYDPLERIIEISLEYIKIDKCILVSAENNKKAKIVLKYIFALGKYIDLDVICEGVEKIEHKDILEKLDCNYMKGDYLVGDVDFAGLQKCFEDI